MIDGDFKQQFSPVKEFTTIQAQLYMKHDIDKCIELHTLKTLSNLMSVNCKIF